MMPPQRFDYRFKVSIPEKENLVKETFKSKVPGYLLFHLGEIWDLSQEEQAKIMSIFFDDGKNGNAELHYSDQRSGSRLASPPRNLQRFTVLRIRDASKMVYAFGLRGFECHLIQVEDGSEHVSINFMQLWGPSPLDAIKDEEDIRPEQREQGELPPPPTVSDPPPEEVLTPKRFCLHPLMGSRLWDAVFGRRN